MAVNMAVNSLSRTLIWASGCQTPYLPSSPPKSFVPDSTRGLSRCPPDYSVTDNLVLIREFLFLLWAILGNRPPYTTHPSASLLIPQIIFQKALSQFSCLAKTSAYWHAGILEINIASRIIFKGPDKLYICDHRLKKTRHPVRSAISKLQIARLVLQWVTMWESLVLQVVLWIHFLSCHLEKFKGKALDIINHVSTHSKSLIYMGASARGIPPRVMGFSCPDRYIFWWVLK